MDYYTVINGMWITILAGTAALVYRTARQKK